MSLTDQSKISEVNVLRTAGASFKVGTPTSVTVLEVDSANDVWKAKGAVVPSDGDAGFAKGCIFIQTDGGVATTFYINEGTAASCDFNAMETSASTITGVTAGNGLTGGGTEGTVSLAVNVDDSTLEINTDIVRVKDAGITAAKLAAAVAGAGLTGGAGSALAVGAGTGITVAADAVGLAAAYTPSHVVKFAGISTTANDLTGTIAITVTGALETDIASAVVRSATADVYVKKATLTADTLTVTLSGAGGVDTIIDYSVLRAVA